MKPEIEELIEIYENGEKYLARIDAAAKVRPVPDIGEILNVQSKISFGKDRQRAELLKLNENFLKELSGIKNRLGDKFFKLMEEEIPRAAVESPARYFRKHERDPIMERLPSDPGTFFGECEEALLKSDFAEPRVVLEKEIYDASDEFPSYVYFLPGTPIDGGGWPESEIDEKDPFFNGPPLEWVIVNYREVELEDPDFKLRCKEEVFLNYLNTWNEFLTKWHISINWDGDLQYLHVHALPSVIVERDNKNHNLPVIIHLGAWATSDDVKRAWPRIEAIMKEARIYRERESEDRLFIRDMIWFRQNRGEALSPSKIAHFWAEKFPAEIDLEVMEKVTRDEETFEDVPLEERLEEVLSDDPKMAELRGRFIEARKAFIRIGLKDKVKKSIKKTEEKIKRLGSEDWDRNREKLLKPSR